MKVIGVVSDDWLSRFSKPMDIKEVKSFKKKHSKQWKYIRFERHYNILEKICVATKRYLR